jgi:transposase
MRTREEKRRIVEESLRGGESVAIIARRHEVNANLVFSWRRLYRKGLLEPAGAALVPVKIRSKTATRRSLAVEVEEDCVEIDLGAGKCLRIRGKLAIATLDRLLADLCSR